MKDLYWYLERNVLRIFPKTLERHLTVVTETYVNVICKDPINSEQNKCFKKLSQNALGP